MPDTTVPRLDALLEHRSWVRDLARRLVRDAAEAEDLAQEAWVRVLRSPPDPDRDPRPWLRRVLQNLARNRWRGDSRRQARESAWRDRRPQRTPAELVEEADQHQRLVRRVLDLDEPFKTTLVLRFYEGLSAREIAERLEIAEGTVHSRVARAVERLRDQLDDEAGGDRKRWIAALLPLTRLDVSVPTAAATATTAASLTGVLVMITKSKLAVLTALALVAVVVGGLWIAFDSDGAEESPEPTPLRDVASGPTLQGTGRALRSEASPTRDAAMERDAVAASPLTGRVVDSRGEPVAGAEVFVLPEGVVGVHADQMANADLPLARTDAEGLFRIERVPDVGQLVAFVEGRLPAGVPVGDAIGGPIELTLPDPRTITLRVEDPDGRWPAHCSVSVDTDWEHTWDRTADASKLGHYMTDGPEPEPRAAEQVIHVATLAPLIVHVDPPRGWVALPRRIVLAADADEASFRLVPSGELRVHVIDAVTGDVLPDETEVSVNIVDLAAKDVVLGVGGRPGLLHVRRDLSPGSYRIEVTAGGYLPATRMLELHAPGERVELVVDLDPSYADDTGRVLLRVVQPEPTAEATPLAAPGGIQYAAMIRETGTTQWVGAHAVVLPDGRLDLRPHFVEKHQPGLSPGTYDIYLARGDRGTAAFLAGTRVFGGQENEVTVTLQPGSHFRVTDLVPPGEQLAKIEVRTQAAGALPMIHWQQGGYWSIVTASAVETLLRQPLEPRILGPFPGEEIEVVLVTVAGEERRARVRGASIDR